MNYVKYIPRFGSSHHQTKYIINRKILKYLKLQFCSCNYKLSELTEPKEGDDVWNKIIYNEILHNISVQKKKIITDNNAPPIFLKYLTEDKEEAKKSTPEKNETKKKSESPNFPYEIKKQFLNQVERSEELGIPFPPSVHNLTPSDSNKNQPLEWGAGILKVDIKNLEKPQRWATDGEEYGNDNKEDDFKFGSFDPNQKVSIVPCGGCGAFLHCNDPSIPGFIPAEVFEGKTKKELRSELCQRCHFLREFHVSLGVNVSPSEYIKILSSIKEKDALAIVMIDLLDFPCSIFPGILDVIGPTKPVVIVANKVDMLIQEEPGYLQNFKNSVLKELKKQRINLNNIKQISLISAKTGYGVEELITQLQMNWGFKGDVYLIGCTNVGKSTLFNTLIQSDYCKVKATNLLQRATISAWPGTTLNLLKFPIMRPNKSRLVARSLRLEYQEKEEAALQKFQWLKQNIKLEQIPLQGYVGKTFHNESKPDDALQTNGPLTEEKPKGLDPKDFDFIKSKWFYDTPGVVHEDQIINLLTTSELLLTVPQRMLLPRNFHMKPGTSLFIAGIGRLDYISGADFVWFTVFASMELPITVTKLEDADYVYKKLLGTPYFRVPMQGEERLSKWPELLSKKFEIVGRVDRMALRNKLYKNIPMTLEASNDVVLSSAGWIAVTVPYSYRCKIEVWTPEGKGIHLRDIPIIKKGFTFRGDRIPGTPVFRNKIKETKGYSLTDKPPL